MPGKATEARAARSQLTALRLGPCHRKLAADFLCHPIKVIIGSQDLAASHSVTQVCVLAAAAVHLDRTLHPVAFTQSAATTF